MAGPYTDPRAHEVRERYLRAFGGPERPVPVESIACDLLGLHVEVRPIAYSGLLLPRERLILVNGEEPPTRRRFTIAHELGHWVCQVLSGRVVPAFCRPVDLSAAADRTLEREANVFAAELLMPEQAVAEEFAGSVAECAACFQVSVEAMHWRLYNLGLVAEPPLQEATLGRST